MISGHDGGTGAAPLTSLKHAGIPWEIGLAETQQTLLANGLRDRIVVQVDGQLKTGRDVVIGALLGAEEFGFATAPLVVSGCIMMRVCHLDTCPVGIATQNPALRAKFSGKPEFVETFFEYIAEEVRELLAALGLRTLEEAVGRVDLLDSEEAVAHWKAAGLDLSAVLAQPDVPDDMARHQTRLQDHGLEKALDHQFMAACAASLEDATPVSVALPISNVDRTVGTLLGSEISRRYGSAGLPDDTISLTFTGSAGQSFGAFVPRGMTMRLYGDANDYFGKGLSGGRLVVRPQVESVFAAEDQIIAGNVILYGATAGEAFIRGQVGERFCVRNSGAVAVVEGVGDHGCEYMTGGRVVVLGPDRPQLRRRHVGRHRLRLRPRAHLRSAGQPRHGRRRASQRRGQLPRPQPRRAPRRRDRFRGGGPAPRALGDRATRVRQGHATGLPAHPRGHPFGRGRGSLGGRGRHGGSWTWVGVMGKPTGFMEFDRSLPRRRPVSVRLRDWREVYEPFSAEQTQEQGARCMDCGIPFCHEGCPLGNLIPEWNDLVYKDDWSDAIERLHATNNFPEFTGRLCPAPCEAACVLGINEDPVTIERIEYEIVERAWSEGWVDPQLATVRTGRSVAVVGSGTGRPGRGPATGSCRSRRDGVRTGREARGPAALRHPRVQNGEGRAGPAPGPDGGRGRDVRLRHVDRWARRGRGRERDGHEPVGDGPLEPGEERGLGTACAPDVTVRSAADVRAQFDAVVMAGGATLPRDLPVPGRDLDGVHLALEYLKPSNLVREGALTASPITAKGKRVIIIGGGDTGADCLGTAHRQGAASVHQFEILPEPPQQRSDTNPWPLWPLILRTSSAHEEGGERVFSVTTTEFVDDGSGAVRALRGHEVETVLEDGRPVFQKMVGTEFELECELVLLAMGFVGTERKGAVEELGLDLDARGAVAADRDWSTNVRGRLRLRRSDPRARASSSGPSPKGAPPRPPSTGS